MIDRSGGPGGPSRCRLVVWDVDGTMLSRSMERRFTALLREEGLLSRWSLARRTAATWLRYPTTDSSAIKFCYLRDLPVRQIESIATTCLQERILPEVYDGVRASIEALSQNGFDQLLVTGGPSFLARPLGAALGIPDVIDCTPVTVDGRYTGLLDGLHPRGENKVRTVRRFLAENGYAWEECAALADHEFDLPLFRQIGRPIACNPTPRLQKAAVAAGWPILHQPFNHRDLLDLLAT